MGRSLPTRRRRQLRSVNPGPGLDSDGDVNRRSLTLRGWQRSGALAATHLCGLLANPRGSVSVLVPRYAHTEHHRPYQTVRALADRLEAIVEDPCEAADVDALEQRVLEADATVVICWEHDALVTFARRLAPAAPADWPHGRFDVIWVLQRQADGGGYDWRQLWQDLLPGDMGEG